jgi:glutamate/tyrosine decarboxylase-like PLP-dependent enzyme
MHLPRDGRAWAELKLELLATKSGDYAWKRGRLPLYVYWKDEELNRVVQEAYALFFTENSLGQRAFPSLARLEREVIEMGLDLLQAEPGSGGSFTSGGTESIFQAVKTARDRARAQQPQIIHPKIVVPQSAHPAFHKAAHYLGLREVRIPLGREFRADVAAMEREIDDDTIMIVGSAPTYPHGVFDPIEELGRLALSRGLWLHVDACVGGMLSPFLRRLGYGIPPFDFAVPGVTSISADLHKYGFAAKGASLILYRDAELKRYQRFEFRDWPRGFYATDTFAGTRAGGPVAAAWAVMNYLGEEGYLEIARTIMETKARFIQGIGSVEGIEIIEPNELSFLLYRSNDPRVDINAVAEGMTKRGWFVGRCVEPSAVHLMFNPVHAPVVGEYVGDLEAAVAEARALGSMGVLDERTY